MVADLTSPLGNVEVVPSAMGAADGTMRFGGTGSSQAAPPEADGRETIRVNLQQLQSGAATARNVDLRDGDTIYVARAEVVYVFGHVKNPGSYPIKSHTTVLQALALAGGVMPSGAMNRTKVLRIVGGDKREIKVKPTDIVQAGDTIVVPERYF